MRVDRALWSAVVALSVAACASPPPPAPIAATATVPATSASPIAAAGGVDGLYRAPAGGVRGNSACGTTSFGYPIRVINGVASMQTVSAGRIEGRVAPDGSLVIDEGRSVLRGQFSGDTFTGSYSRVNCSFALNYRK